MMNIPVVKKGFLTFNRINKEGFLTNGYFTMEAVLNMVFKRKLYKKMLEWKKEFDGKTALLIKGARRIGKSIHYFPICQI